MTGIIQAGERFGRLTVTVTRRPPERHVRCTCDCGNSKEISVYQWGRTKSCGCLRRIATIARFARPTTYIVDGSGAVRIPVGKHHTAIVDAADLHLVSAHRWTLLKGHTGKLYAYASTTDGSTYMHRLIAGTPDGMETDHINGDGLDNRRANLRLVTPSQNSANMGKPRRPDGSPHSSKFKGVSWDKSRGKWQSKIATLDPTTGRTRHRNLGRYDSEEDAARAYDDAALAHWGEFARLNFPAVAA